MNVADDDTKCLQCLMSFDIKQKITKNNTNKIHHVSHAT